MAKGIPNARCTGEFTQKVVEDMQKNKLSQQQASSKYGVQRSVLQQWARIYLEEDAQGLYVERRGPAKLVKQVEED